MTGTPQELVHDVTNRVKANSKTDIRRPRSGGFKMTSRLMTGKMSRPSTQERSIELRKTSVSRTSVMTDEFSHSRPPKPIFFSNKKPLDNIKPRLDKQRLGRVEEHSTARRQSNNAVGKSKGNHQTNYAAYRQSLVKYGRNELEENGRTDIDNDKSLNGVLPRRNVPPVPLVMGVPRSRPHRDVDPLYSSHNNFDRLAKPRDFDNRPKTSPEILERRPGSTASVGVSNDRIQLKNPDHQLIDLMTILNNSNGTTRQGTRFIPSPPQTMGSGLDGNANNASNIHRNLRAPLSSSFVSVKGNSMSKPSSAGSSNFGSITFGSTGSKEQTDLLRELIKSQVTSNKPSSRKSTPEQGKKARRPVSGKGHNPASPARLPAVTPHRKKRVGRRPRCAQCNRRIQISNTYNCRCGGFFCGQHRYAETHSCTFDYKTEGRKLLHMSNPLVEPQKLPKI